MVRVTPEDESRWLQEFRNDAELRREFGITAGPLYRDVEDAAALLIHLDVADMEQAGGYFSDPRFEASAERAGPVGREVFLAERQAH